MYHMEQSVSSEDLDHPTYVCRLKKALYGLKQAPRAWSNKIREYLFHIGFYVSDADHSLYVRKGDVGLVIIVIYVDDLIITGDNDSGIAEVTGVL